MCGACDARKEARPDIYPSHLPKNALTDPRGVLSQLLGEVKELREANDELRRLIVETRQMQLGQAVHIEELEKRIKVLESGGY